MTIEEKFKLRTLQTRYQGMRADAIQINASFQAAAQAYLTEKAAIEARDGVKYSDETLDVEEAAAKDGGAEKAGVKKSNVR